MAMNNYFARLGAVFILAGLAVNQSQFVLANTAGCIFNRIMDSDATTIHSRGLELSDNERFDIKLKELNEEREKLVRSMDYNAKRKQDEIEKFLSFAETKEEKCSTVFDEINKLRQQEAIFVDRNMCAYLSECEQLQRKYCNGIEKYLLPQYLKYSTDFKKALAALSGKQKLSYREASDIIALINSEFNLVKRDFGNRVLKQYELVQAETSELVSICVFVDQIDECARAFSLLDSFYLRYSSLQEYLDRCKQSLEWHCSQQASATD